MAKIDYDEEVDTNTSVHWFNSKGFYIVIDKIMTFIAVQSLENDYLAWFRGLDRLASFTRPFWKRPKDFAKFEELYGFFLKNHGSSSKVLNGIIKQNILTKEYEYIRKAERIIFDNISHLFLRTDEDDLDDEDDWVTAHLRNEEQGDDA
jgi:hypothetical protein